MIAKRSNDRLLSGAASAGITIPQITIAQGRA